MHRPSYRPALLIVPLVVGGLLGRALAAGTTFERLPQGLLSTLPNGDTRPDEIPGREKVAGIYPAVPPDQYANYGIKGTRYVSLFTNEAEAEQYGAGNLGSALSAAVAGLVEAARPQELRPGPACFVVADQWQMQRGSDEWPLAFERQPSIQGVEKGSPAAQQFPDVGVQAVHLESLSVEGTKATLQMRDAWIDPGTSGVRLVAESKMPLQLVAEGPPGVKVFAAREDGNNVVHFVVQVLRADERSSMYVGNHMMLFRGGESGHSDCGHARISLQSAPASGDRGWVQLDLVLPADEEEPPAVEADAGDPSSPLGGYGAMVVKEVRIRTLQVHLAVSQASSDATPVVSVGFGWQGRERRMETY